MKNKWIIDVLTDLRDFASKNELPVLQSQLDLALVAAISETTSDEGVVPFRARMTDGKSRSLHRKVANT